MGFGEAAGLVSLQDTLAYLISLEREVSGLERVCNISWSLNRDTGVIRSSRELNITFNVNRFYKGTCNQLYITFCGLWKATYR
jgi:hypothetical protein